MSNIEDERRAHPPPKFVSGSILRHILEMTAAGAVGLMAIFLGDLANIYFLSLSGDQTVVAAVGYASSILFLSTSIGIGLSIATASIVAPAIGGGHREAARRLSTHAHVLTFAVSAALSAVLWLLIPQLLSLLGATGEAHAAATRYLKILIPTLPLLAGGMTSSSVLRSVGDAKRSMLVTLYGAIVNTILDAILILKLGLGIEGAAMSSTLARATVAGIGLYGVACVHKLLERPNLASMADDTPAFAAIALPAVLTNIATPVSNAYVTWAIAPYGNGAIAGWAVIGRIIPVAFGSVYALSGVVGPIIGQNWGARRIDRMRGVLTEALLVMTAFTAIAWLVLALLAYPLADLFKATGDARALIVFFCRWLSPLFVFLGAMFIANASFNTLGRAHLSTALNWARATIGTVPFVMAGGHLAGSEGVLAGHLAGGILFGTWAVWLAYAHLEKIRGELASKPALLHPNN